MSGKVNRIDVHAARRVDDVKIVAACGKDSFFRSGNARGKQRFAVVAVDGKNAAFRRREKSFVCHSDGVGINRGIVFVGKRFVEIEDIVSAHAVFGGVDVQAHIFRGKYILFAEGGAVGDVFADYGKIGRGVNAERSGVFDVKPAVVRGDVRHVLRVLDAVGGRHGSILRRYIDAGKLLYASVREEQNASGQPHTADVLICAHVDMRGQGKVVRSDENVSRCGVVDGKVSVVCGKQSCVGDREIAVFGKQNVEIRLFGVRHGRGRRREHRSQQNQRAYENARERKNCGRFRQRFHTDIISKSKSYVNTITIC